MFLKSKKFWIVAVIILVVMITLVNFLSSDNQATQYEVVKVKKGDLIQTVDITGKIKSENNVSLHFETSGVVDKIYVVEGEEVRGGDILAKLNLESLNTLIKQAEANLEQKIAGASEEQINVSKKQVDAAEVAYKKAETNLSSVQVLANENLENKYTSALNLLDDIYIKLFDDLKFCEDLKDKYFTSLTQESIGVKNKIEYDIKDPLIETKEILDIAKNTQFFVDIDNAISKMNLNIKSTLDALLFIKNISENINYKNVISSLDKSTLDQNKLTLSTSQISLTNFQNELSLLIIQNKNNITSSELSVKEALANLELQKANYNSLIASPRDVDLAYLRTTLTQAITNREKAIIKSPINGIVTKVNKKTGELISSAEALIEVLSPKYQIEVNVPEIDVTKISVGDKADIELDAIENKTFKAQIISINPAANTIQDVVYYKVVLSILDEDDRIRPGMTADILIFTDEKFDVLYLPSRSILSDKDRKYVRILENGNVIEKDVEIGLNADDSKKEILSGLSEGEEVILKINK